MVIFLFLIIFLYLKNCFGLSIHKILFKQKKILNFNKTNLNKWMNLTKKERYNLSKKESVNYLNKRKVLLGEIREEYKRISKDNSDKNK